MPSASEVATALAASRCYDLEMSLRRSRLRCILERLALLSLGLFLASLLSEAVVRWAAPQQLVVIRPDIWRPDASGLGWRRAPNLETRVNTGERTVELFTDARGRRVGAGGPAASPHIRILAIGDSFLEALQVEYEASIPGLLESDLGARLGAPVEVANTGVGGYGPNHYLRLARTELLEGAYDGMLVFLFLGNDVATHRRDTIPASMPVTRHALRWPRALRAHELIDAWLHPLNDYLEQRSHAFVLLRGSFPVVKRRLVAIRRAAKGETSSPEALFRHHVTNPAMDDSPRWALTAEICAEIGELADAHGVPLLFVLLPRDSWIDPDALKREAVGIGIESARMDPTQPARRIGAELTARGLPFLDTQPALIRAWQQGERRLYGRADNHFAPAGHRRVADLVLERLLASWHLPIVATGGEENAT